MQEGASLNKDGDLFLFYAHLDSVKEFSFGDKVTAGDKLGTIGRLGVTQGTKAPHLHFEIFSNYTMAKTKYRINPAFCVDYKDVNDMSETEKELQETEKERGCITTEKNGKNKLVYDNMEGFKK